MLRTIPLIPWLLLCLLTSARLAGETLSVREIQELSLAEPFREKLVTAEGVVTWSDPAEGNFFYIQDTTGGLQVQYTGGRVPKPGDILQVEGVLQRGTFTSVIADAVLRHLGYAHLPTLKRASVGGLLNGIYMGERVEINGWVRSVRKISPNVLGLELMSGTDRISARISNHPENNAESLLACQLLVRGVASPLKARGFNQLISIQILSQGSNVFTITERTLGDPWMDPVVSLRDTFRFRPGQTRGDRRHVRARVVLSLDGTVYLNDGASGLAARGDDVDRLLPGDWVEAIGFPDIEDHLPVLTDTLFRFSPDKGLERPVELLPASQLLDGLRHSDHVAMAGELIDRMRMADAKTGEKKLTLVLQADQGVFLAELRDVKGEKEWAGPDIGSLLKVTGICQVHTDAAGDAVDFKLLLPSADDVAVLQEPSPFTVKRLLVALSVALSILATLMGVAILLARRNVRLKAEVIEKQIVAAERSRMARDLHDTLEQGLTGIHLHLHGIGKTRADISPETLEKLEAISEMVQHCHQEMRSTIWNLRSASLERADLGKALERTALSIALGSSLQVRLEQRRDGSRLPPLIEDELLRIGQEAVTNAVKHSGATHLSIVLETTAERAVLSIHDDGRGMTEPNDSSGTEISSFGIVGMRERAARMRAELEIISPPGSGCTVRVTVPLAANRVA